MTFPVLGGAEGIVRVLLTEMQNKKILPVTYKTSEARCTVLVGRFL